MRRKSTAMPFSFICRQRSNSGHESESAMEMNERYVIASNAINKIVEGIIAVITISGNAVDSIRVNREFD
jgi:hypothetical protein